MSRINEPRPDFDREWSKLTRKLRVRALVKGATIGCAVGAVLGGSLLVWFLSDSTFAYDLASFVPPNWGASPVDSTLGLAASESPHHGPYSWMWPSLLWALPVMGLLIGMAAAWPRKRSKKVMAAWADTLGEGSDTVQTAFEASGPFGDRIRNEAAVVVRRARTTNPPLAGSLKYVVVALVALFAGAVSHLWWQYTLEDPKAPPPITHGQAILSGLNAAGGLLSGGGEELATWASAVGLDEVAMAAKAATEAKKLLDTSGITQEEALAVVSKIEDATKKVSGGGSTQSVLDEIMNSPELMATAQKIMKARGIANRQEGAAEDGSLDADALSNVDPAQLERLARVLGSEGGARPNGSEGGGRPTQPKDGRGWGEVAASALGGFIGKSSLASRLFGGQVTPAQARVALEANRKLEAEAASAKKRILSGGTGSDTGSGTVSGSQTSYAMLLKDLPDGGRVHRANTSDNGKTTVASDGAAVPSSVAATGRTLTASAEDYHSRGHRLPRDVRDTASRYFAGGK